MLLGHFHFLSPHAIHFYAVAHPLLRHVQLIVFGRCWGSGGGLFHQNAIAEFLPL
jgi:hypothetical protein